MSARPHALYRFFDATGVLLYIGITSDIPARLKQHGSDKPWWLDVARIAIDPFPDRQSVLAAEKRAIQTEAPLWNVQHQPRERHPVAPSSQLRAYCEECYRIIPQPDGGVIHVELDAIHQHRAAQKAWERQTTRPDGRREWRLADIEAMPKKAEWHVHCYGCNPHFSEELGAWCPGCYSFDVGDCGTWAKLVTRTAHLAGKDWLQSTDWMQFIARVGYGKTLTGLISAEDDMAQARGDR